MPQEKEIIRAGQIEIRFLLEGKDSNGQLLEARPCAGESDAEIVAGARDFERINRRYARI